MQNTKQKELQKQEERQRKQDEAVKQSTQNAFVKVDVDFEEFQGQFFELVQSEQAEVFKAITKLQKMTWQDLWNTSTKGHGKRRSNYEPIDQQTAEGLKVATIRVSGSFRARVTRKNEWLIFISLHPDHDSAYIH